MGFIHRPRVHVMVSNRESGNDGAMSDGLVLIGLLLVILPVVVIVAAMASAPADTLDRESGVTDP